MSLESAQAVPLSSIGTPPPNNFIKSECYHSCINNLLQLMNIWGYCYLLWYKDLNIYKIGFGKSAKKRHLQLQRTYPKPLYLVDSCYCFNPRLLEKQLHQEFSSRRERRGEFFLLDDDDVVSILQTFSSKRGEIIEKQQLARVTPMRSNSRS